LTRRAEWTSPSKTLNNCKKTPRGIFPLGTHNEMGKGDKK
jgi:hypothetical protein